MANNVRHFTGRGGSTGGGEPPMNTLEERVSRIEDTMATKDQLELAKTQLEMKILESASDSKVQISGLRSEMKEEIGSLRSEMHSLLRQQIMWSVGSVVTVAGLVFAILRFTGA